MWDALAPIVRWPLYSARRFAAVVIVALAAVFLVGQANDHSGSGPTTAVSASPSEAVSTTAAPSPSDSLSDNVVDRTAGTDDLGADETGGDPSAAAADAAAAFVAAWARPDLDAQAWSAGVRPLVTSELWSSGLSTTNPASTPDVTVRGQPRQVAINAEEGVLDVPTTGAWIRVHVVPAPAGGTWLVSSVEPAG
ncbi:hypothetical protein [Cellulomonas alba]|uniref:Secreted protein n=1 Tax=Cellulomonas alba TaxID=3053467 RepID=A0ABT7SHZ5_9CELL|nr:hypothetical protein [Cellulomonas alba]MDM7855798.1 hypothetical protein [Cellulomonas alba]